MISQCGGKRMNQRGQVVILLAITLPVLLMFSALAIDVGFAYVTKAKLSKSVDAACLTAMKNLSQGQTTARTLALNAFAANYGTSGLDIGSPVVASTSPLTAPVKHSSASMPPPPSEHSS